LKRTFLHAVCPQIFQRFTKRGSVDNPLLWCMSAMVSVPFSYVEERDRVRFTLGRRDRPVTVRVPLRGEFESDLDGVVTEVASVDVDDVVTRALLRSGEKQPQWVGHLLRWGPPEERVRALLACAHRGDEPEATTACKRLLSFGERWNREAGVPAAPRDLGDRAAFVRSWQEWYASMRPLTRPGPESVLKPGAANPVPSGKKPSG
jgi:hypothetical protein